MAGVVVTAIALVFNLSTTMSYALIGIIGLGIVIYGIISDIFIAFHERREVVKVHEPAISAEEGYCPKAPFNDFSPGFIEALDKERVHGRAPLGMSTGRTRPNVLFFQKRHKRVKAEVRFGHGVDPTPLTRA